MTKSSSAAVLCINYILNYNQVPEIQFSSTTWIQKVQSFIISQWFNYLSDLIALTNTVFIIVRSTYLVIRNTNLVTVFSKDSVNVFYFQVLISGDISQPSRVDMHSLWVCNYTDLSVQLLKGREFISINRFTFIYFKVINCAFSIYYCLEQVTIQYE